MTLYTFALFLHVLGALVLGAVNALLLAGLLRARQASTVEELRLWSALAHGNVRVVPLAVLLLLVPAVYLVVAAWGWTTPWIDVALGAVVIMALLGRFGFGQRLAALHAEALQAAGGPIPLALQRRRADRTLWTTMWASMALFLGVVFLMTNKPDLLGALVTVAVAIVAGTLVSIFMRPPAAAGPDTVRQAPMALGLDNER
jgi:hypothetical protein